MNYIFKRDKAKHELQALNASEIKGIADGNQRVILSFPGADAMIDFMPEKQFDKIAGHFTPQDLEKLSGGEFVKEKKPEDIIKGANACRGMIHKLESMCQGEGMNETLNNAVILSTGYIDYMRSIPLNTIGLRREYNNDSSVNDETSKFNTKAESEVVKSFLLKFVTDETGKRFTNYEDAGEKIQKLTLFSYSAGSAHIGFVNNIMANEMAKLNYSEPEIKDIMSKVHMVTVAPSAKLSDNPDLKFSSVSIEAVNDIFAGPMIPGYEEKAKLIKDNKDCAVIKEHENKVTVLITNQHETGCFNYEGRVENLSDSHCHNMRNYSNYKTGENNVGAVAIENTLRNLLTGKGDKLENIEDLLTRDIVKHEDRFSAVRNIYSKYINELVNETKQQFAAENALDKTSRFRFDAMVDKIGLRALRFETDKLDTDLPNPLYKFQPEFMEQIVRAATVNVDLDIKLALNNQPHYMEKAAAVDLENKNTHLFLGKEDTEILRALNDVAENSGKGLEHAFNQLQAYYNEIPIEMATQQKDFTKKLNKVAQNNNIFRDGNSNRELA